MANVPDNIQEQIAALRQAYAEQLLGKIQQIEQIWGNRHTEWDDRALATFFRMTHNLAGSGATFGFASLSDRAYTLERFLRSLMNGNHELTPEKEAQITALVELLKQSANQPSVESTIQQLDRHILFPQAIPPVHTDNRLIYLVKDRLEQAKEMIQQISYFGYLVKGFQSFSDLRKAVQQNQPAAIIIDIVSADGSFAGIETLTAIQQDQAIPIPVVFISVRGDLQARLQAVQAGCHAYFTKPLEIGALVDRLDELTAHQMPEPYRIMIVEDEATLAQYYAFTLEQAGMLTTVVTDPLQVMQPLIEFRPDLILMDVYMPRCSGLALAAVIRQWEAYVSIPIVFLSTETNRDKQLSAMSLGGDDFLMKPIHPDHLVKAVETRARRSRILRSFMVKDSLTGLFNHTKIKEQLAIELTRAQRQHTNLVFAMLDIDRFKSVNDTYGHQVGDRVIKSLARLLMQRLRKTDCIGRYGGEEFAVILPDTDGPTAVKVLDELRLSFAKIRHQAQRGEFSVTFSCGLAAYPSHTDLHTLSDAADRALYAAKSLGRNQVVLSGG